MDAIFKNKVRVDFLVIVGWVLFSIPLILYFKAIFLTSTIVFFAIPAFYLFIRKPKQLKRLGATLATGVITLFIVDLLAEFNKAWSWAPQNQLVFPNKIFGLVPIDVLIWYVFWISFTIIYYEHFFEHERSEKMSKRFKKAAIFALILFVLVVGIFLTAPSLLQWHYAYLAIGFMGALPFFYVIFKDPHMVGKLLKADVFNIFLFLSFELTALKLNQWRFPGQYIGTIQLFGLTFPFEEFTFWIVWGTPIMLSYYELFIDDEN